MEGHTTLRLASIGFSVLFLLLLAAFPASGRQLVQQPCELVPGAWKPSLEQVQNSLEELSHTEQKTTQRQLTQTSQNLADLRDAQLFIVYVQLIQALHGKERTALCNEQKHWLGKREEWARSGVVSQGGTLEPLEYSGAFRKITEERLSELQKRLQPQRATTNRMHSHRGKQP